MVLSSIMHLIPHVAVETESNSSAELKKFRDILVNMFGVYWTKRVDMYNKTTRLMTVRCILAFIQVTLLYSLE